MGAMLPGRCLGKDHFLAPYCLGSFFDPSDAFPLWEFESEALLSGLWSVSKTSVDFWELKYKVFLALAIVFVSIWGTASRIFLSSSLINYINYFYWLLLMGASGLHNQCNSTSNNFWYLDNEENISRLDLAQMVISSSKCTI